MPCCTVSSYGDILLTLKPECSLQKLGRTVIYLQLFTLLFCDVTNQTTEETRSARALTTYVKYVVDMKLLNKEYQTRNNLIYYTTEYRNT